MTNSYNIYLLITMHINILADSFDKYLVIVHSRRRFDVVIH